jgi:branched-chain amino acid transport system ATP-binding protein
MAKPSILMFDEPSLGLSPLFTQTLFEIIRTLKKEGMTMLLVEQNVQMSLAISDFAYVLDHGKVAIEGDAKTVRAMPEVRKAYLGL